MILEGTSPSISRLYEPQRGRASLVRLCVLSWGSLFSGKPVRSMLYKPISHWRSLRGQTCWWALISVKSEWERFSTDAVIVVVSYSTAAAVGDVRFNQSLIKRNRLFCPFSFWWKSCCLLSSVLNVAETIGCLWKLYSGTFIEFVTVFSLICVWNPKIIFDVAVTCIFDYCKVVATFLLQLC